MRNAYKLYHQTRPFASPASAHRAKEMDRTQLHPLMRKCAAVSAPCHVTDAALQ